MISAYVKANVKQQDISYLVAVKKLPSKLEIQCKKGMYFYLILVAFHSTWYCLLRTEGGGWGFA